MTNGSAEQTARIAAAHLKETKDYYRRLKAFVETDDEPAANCMIEITRTVIKLSAAMEKTAYASDEYGKPRECPKCSGDVYCGDRYKGSKFRGSYQCEDCGESWSFKTADKFPHKDKAPKRIFTVCVDLDGTVASEDKDKPFDPKVIGAPRPGVRKWLKLFKKLGARLVLWTVRGDTLRLWEYVREHDLPFDCINENPDQPKDSSGKLVADVYVDNRAVNAAGAWPSFGPTVVDKINAAA